MTWFEQITGFPESDYDTTQSRLCVQDGQLIAEHPSRTRAVGQFEIPSLAELRQRVAEAPNPNPGRLRFSAITADAGDLHRDPANAQALFQVASQFNALEMVGPSVTPEHGVSRYANDLTQGPACAIAAGAATIWRNYLMPLEGGIGQREGRQVDTLRDLGTELGNQAGELWQMRNGYALCSEAGLGQIDKRLASADAHERQRLSGMLRIALHWDVEVTQADEALLVSQAFCSALPCSYSQVPLARWERFARLVLEAAYEATLLAGMLNWRRTGNPVVYLTRLGGGAFGNAEGWIFDAFAEAVRRYADCGLDVRLVCFGAVPEAYKRLAEGGD